MEDLINLNDDEPSKLQHQLISPILSPVYGVIKYKCLATIVSGIADVCGEVLKPGTLIQIVTDFRKEGCYFKICDFMNLLGDYTTAIYKCPVDNYLAVSSELWPYLCTIKMEDRVKFVQNVYNGVHNIDLLELNREIRIRTPTRAEGDYYEFIVKYIGPVGEIGIGNYIGLQMKKRHVSLPFDWKCMSQYYKYGGVGIIVSLNWIMINLFDEQKSFPKSLSQYEHLDQKNLVSINKSKNIIKVCPGISSTRNSTTILCPNKECNYSWDNPRNGLANNARCPECNANWCYICSNAHEPGERHGFKSSTAPTKVPSSNEMGAIPKVPKKKCAKCNLCSKIVELDGIVILQGCQHLFCKKCMRCYVERNSKVSRIQCPYSAEKCHFDLLDAEIKVYGGDFIYNEILDNRLKESLGSDPSATVCPNIACKHIWNIPPSSHINNSRCPKCKTNKCHICHTAHEPGSPHGNQPDKLVTTQNVEGPVSKTATCDKCCKLNIPLGAFISLENCNHTFCNECIVPIIKTQTSGSYYAQCPMCNKNLEDLEVSKIGGYSGSFEKCCCQPQATNCSIFLKCKHKFCRTLLTDILREQLQRDWRAACPTCFETVDEHLMEDLFNHVKISTSRSVSEENFTQLKTKQGATKKMAKSDRVIELNDQPFLCIICEQQVPIIRGVIFNGCHHSFCLACCREFIEQQVSSERIPSCPICRKPLDQFQMDGIMLDNSQNTLPKIEPVRKTTNNQKRIQVNPITNNQKRIQVNSLINNRPVYPKKTSLQRRKSSSDSPKDNTCSVCYEKFKNKIILKECGHEFCRQCVTMSITAQQVNGTAPTCPMCRKSVDPDQIMLRNGVCDKKHPVKESNRKTDTIQLNHEANTTLQLNDRPFQCIICDEYIRPFLGVVLNNCGDSLCKECALNVILQQSTDSISPNCPLCQAVISDNDVRMLAPGIYDIFLENRLHLNNIVEPHPFQQPRRENRENRVVACNTNVCFVCHANLRQKFMLSNCGHQFCRRCIQGRITEHQSNGSKPTCPKCRRLIAPHQIAMLNTTAYQQNRKFETKLRFNYEQFVCPICDKTIDPECGVLLSNCGDMFCFNCISDVLLQQSAGNLSPNCPLCQNEIPQDEVRMIDPTINDIFLENRRNF